MAFSFQVYLLYEKYQPPLPPSTTGLILCFSAEKYMILEHLTQLCDATRGKMHPRKLLLNQINSTNSLHPYTNHVFQLPTKCSDAWVKKSCPTEAMLEIEELCISY